MAMADHTFATPLARRFMTHAFRAEAHGPPLRYVVETAVEGRIRRDILGCGHAVFTYASQRAAMRRRCADCMTLPVVLAAKE